MPSPDYRRWINRETVTPDEAAYLLVNEKPPTERSWERPSREHEFAEEWLTANVLTVDLPWALPIQGTGPGPVKMGTQPGYRMADLLAALERQPPPRAFGQELLDAALKARDEEPLPDSAPLEARASADIRRRLARGEFVNARGKTPKQAIKAFLRSRIYFGLSGRAQERIASTYNPRKVGGRPRAKK